MAARPSSLPPPLRDIPASSLDSLPGLSPVACRVVAGSMLFRQGDAGFGIFRLVTGRIRLVRCTAGGAELGMHTVRPGELFAEASLFSARYHCDAVALEDSDVFLYSKDALTEQLLGNPAALLTFTAELARRVQSLRTGLEIRQIRSARERTLQFLGLHCDATGLWTRDGTLMHLAQDIGLSHEALYRTLAALEREGRITRLPEGIRLHLQPVKGTEPMRPR